MDALGSFSHLADGLPTWIQRLSDLYKQVAERHAEFTKLSKGTNGSMHRKRTGSTESLRPGLDEFYEPPTSAPMTSGMMYAEPSCPNTPQLRAGIDPNNRHIFRDIRNEKRQKRKSTSMVSGASGPPRFRSRMSIIVYYDSCIQDDFQWLVRNIAGARNNLRKGKTAASFKSRMAALGMEESPFGREGSISLRNPNIPRLAKSRNGPYSLESNGSEAFDLVDKNLEIAQTLCEVGAHQFLRDGSCYEELAGTQERFETCLRIAREQVANLKAEAEEAEKREAEHMPSGAFRMAVDPAPLGSLTIDITPAAPPLSGTGIIEVDQNDTSNDIQIDLSAFRSTRRAMEAEPAHKSPFNGDGMLAVDDNDDGMDIQIDLTAFKSSRRGRNY